MKMKNKIALLGIGLLTISGSIFAKGESLLEKIQKGGVVSVGTEGTYPPFTYHDKSGKLTGYDVEVTRAVAKKLGFKVEFKETNWDSMLAGLKAGRFDLVANQVALTNAKRQANFDKSEPYSYSGAVVVAVKNAKFKINKLSDIKGLKAAQSISSNYGEIAVQNKAMVVPVDGLAQSIKVLETKRADILINDNLAVLDYLQKHPKTKIRIVWSSKDKKGAGLIADKGNKEAIDLISKAMIELKADGTLKKIGEKFFGTDISKE